jgi:RNA-binding protein
VFALTPLQKRHLKALAHPRKLIVIVGDRGVTPEVMLEIGQALDRHELIKIRVNAGDRRGREVMISEICAASGAALVQRVGHVATLYRRNHETPRVELP